MRQRERRPMVRRAVYYVPNGFTLFNLFCGIYSIVLSSRGSFSKAALYIFLGGIADALDGRVARATGSGSRMGEELDSLVDAISFGLAPAMIMYFAVLNRENFEWIFVFLFSACAVVRLARFNVEQAGRAKTHFHGLPSPAAGLTLSTYYWFSQTSLYNQTIILFTDNKTLVELPWHAIIPGLMGLLAALMVSNVPYPAVPTFGWRSLRQLAASIVLIAAFVGAVFFRSQFLFPALLAYVLFGALKWLAFGLIGRRAEPDEIYFQMEPEEELAAVAVPMPRRTPSSTMGIPPAPSVVDPGVRRKRRRRRRPGERDDRPDGGARESPTRDSARDTRDTNRDANRDAKRDASREPRDANNRPVRPPRFPRTERGGGERGGADRGPEGGTPSPGGSVTPPASPPPPTPPVTPPVKPNEEPNA